MQIFPISEEEKVFGVIEQAERTPRFSGHFTKTSMY